MSKIKKDRLAVSLMKRFIEIRTMCNDGAYTIMSPIKAKVKGNTRMYTVLKDQGLITKDAYQLFKWNEKVPITYTLAASIAKLLRNYDDELTEKEHITPNDDPIKRKRKKKNTLDETEIKTGLTVSFAWGLFKYIKT